MATGGGEMSRSLVGSSDVIHDFSCIPCAEDGKNTEAVHYCVNCETYFCQTCVLHHNKVLKSHKLLDKDAMTTAAKQMKRGNGVLPLPSQECEDHPGNIVQMFCGTHDVCCCTVCIALDHRACKNVDFIPKLAKGILDGNERQSAKSSLEKIKRKLLQLKFEKEGVLTELKKTKQDVLEDIQQIKERLIARVNEMERMSREEVCEKYEKIAEKVNDNIDTLNDLLQYADARIKRIEQSQNNESELFVAVKYGQKFELACKPVRQQFTEGNVEKLSFVVSKDIEALIDNFDSFGTVKMTDNDNHPCSAALSDEYNIKVTEDVETCTIYDICVLDDGQYIITDFANNKIKKLDKKFTVIDWCTVARPWGVCKTGTNELAVTSLCENQDVLFVNYNSKIECTRSFKVGLPCRGIAYKTGEIIVACGQKYHPNEVRIYSLSGSLLNKYIKDVKGNPMFSSITHLVMNTDGSAIYLADQDKGLITFDRQNNKSSVFTDKRLIGGYGLCADDHDQYLLCGHKSHNVFQLNSNGTLVKEILKKSDRIYRPISVTVLTKPRRLVVTTRSSNTVKVFKLI